MAEQEVEYQPFDEAQQVRAAAAMVSRQIIETKGSAFGGTSVDHIALLEVAQWIVDGTLYEDAEDEEEAEAPVFDPGRIQLTIPPPTPWVPFEDRDPQATVQPSPTYYTESDDQDTPVP